MKMQAPAARRYARALCALAQDAGARDAVRADLAALKRALDSSPELLRFSGNYLVPQGIRDQSLKQLFESRVQPLTWRFLRFLESKRRLGILGQIAAVYEDDEQARSGVVRGTVTTAVPLDDGRLVAVSGRASAKTGYTVTLSKVVDASLLGGFCLQVGDTVYDYSLAARLKAARMALAEGQG